MLLISLRFIRTTLSVQCFISARLLWIFFRREGEGVGLIPKVFHQVKMGKNMYPTSLQITNHKVLVSLLGLCME